MDEYNLLNSVFKISVKDDLSVKVSPKPSLRFDLSKEVLFLSYPGPAGFGQQYFSFNPDDFIFCFNQAKYKHEKSKFDYIPFEDLFFKNFHPKANSLVKAIFDFFSITPTAIAKSRKLASRHKVVYLDIKPSKVLSALNIKVPKKSSEGRKISLDIDEVNRLNFNMQNAIKKAAVSWDFSFFDIYLENYIELRRISHLPTYLSPRMLQNIRNSFSKSVDTFQNKLYNNPEE